jgi:HK97 gp10 family phage protein
MKDFTLDIKGLDELEQILKQMPDQFNYKFLTGAHKTALKPFIEEAKRRAPVGTKDVVSKKYASRSHKAGNLRDSIGVGLAPKSRKLAGVWAGARAEYFRGRAKANAYYAHMVEFGHKGVAPHPFIRPAWDATKGNLIKNISTTYIERMKKLIKRLAKRGSR